jgi:hypothetical protein
MLDVDDVYRLAAVHPNRLNGGAQRPLCRINLDARRLWPLPGGSAGNTI